MRVALLVSLCIASMFGRAAAAPASPPEDAPPRLVRYEPAPGELKFVYGVAPPVARLRPGDVLETRTADAAGNALQKPGDTLRMVKGFNPLTGPFYIEGAEPGDTLVVRLLDLKVDSNQGFGAMAHGFGALGSSEDTPMLNPPLPERIWFYPIDHESNTATFRALDSDFSVPIPLHPFLGCLGVAPAMGESRASVTPGAWGGNMDSPEINPEQIIYLPVNVSGALLYLGDGHAAQGDGEVAGTGIEVPMRVRLQVDVIKGRAIAWPRLENDAYLMVVGAVRPLDDSLRIAFTQLIEWIHTDYGLSRFDAYELLSKVARIRLSEMVDPNYVVIAKIEKKFLPPRKK